MVIVGIGNDDVLMTCDCGKVGMMTFGVVTIAKKERMMTFDDVTTEKERKTTSQKINTTFDDVTNVETKIRMMTYSMT